MKDWAMQALLSSYEVAAAAARQKEARSIVSFRVDGQPMPKGSKTAVAYRDPTAPRGVRARVIEGGNLSRRTRDLRRAWAEAIALAARAAMNGRPPARGALEVDAWFLFARPKRAPDRAYPTVVPDLDKLLRAALDPMRGIVFEDDAQIVKIKAHKWYTETAKPYAAFTVAQAETP